MCLQFWRDWRFSTSLHLHFLLHQVFQSLPPCTLWWCAVYNIASYTTQGSSLCWCCASSTCDCKHFRWCSVQRHFLWLDLQYFVATVCIVESGATVCAVISFKYGWSSFPPDLRWPLPSFGLKWWLQSLAEGVSSSFSISSVSSQHPWFPLWWGAFVSSSPASHHGERPKIKSLPLHCMWLFFFFFFN